MNHNIPVLRDIISQPRFLSGDITTNFISEVYPNGFKGQQNTVLVEDGNAMCFVSEFKAGYFNPWKVSLKCFCTVFE